ncbi:cbb3-type cytochrome oxidase assembly protein CcoS [Marinoscillum sp. MHG1-6]|uniref:cbb3-type cytochrome oxidase assembly protein CcoS n=1 Tax=Marinoscillum sp. MHG1-6 TaxID=2959627 RepID=UPI0021577F55|nr:cbb3-type cytochrome oxidase assembly protein CcoS [Marinoscillum sp. MHG1-6]
MSVIIIMIGISFLVAASFLVAFIWASRTGQFDDDYTPSIRILFDDETKQSTNGNNLSSSERRK